MISKILEKRIKSLYTKKGRLKNNNFIIEGKRSLLTAIDNDVKIKNIVLSKSFTKKNSYFDIFNSGKGKSINILKLLKLISAKLKIKAIIQKKKKQMGDVPFTNSSSFKIKRLLKYEPKIGLNDGIEMFLKWYKSIGIKIK